MENSVESERSNFGGRASQALGSSCDATTRQLSQSVSQSVIRQAARGHVWRGTPFAARRGGFVQVDSFLATRNDPSGKAA